MLKSRPSAEKSPHVATLRVPQQGEKSTFACRRRLAGLLALLGVVGAAVNLPQERQDKAAA